ncbi:phage tail sheath family protein [Ornithinimicrobium sp. LYQ103]|uniref:phage tail sheath family protein n=1 Tax=Ornithinimicrobium sp. LYQ103 TaxID=3378796 RepID=UPI003853ED43
MPLIITPGTYVHELAQPPSIAAQPTSTVAFVGTAGKGLLDEPVEVVSWAEFEGMFGGPVAGCGLPCAVRDFFANGGSRAVVVRVDGIGVPDVRALTGTPGEGLLALERGPVVGFLAIPPPEGDDLPPPAAAEAYAWCVEHRVVLLLDGPTRWTSAATAAKADLRVDLGVTGPNAALYWPRLVQPDPLVHGRARTGSVVGAVAGVLARTDEARGVWTAAAGPEATLRGVDGLAVTLTDADQSLLTPRGVNCLRHFRGGSPVVWGGRTTAADPGWRYLPVRRLVLHIEESLLQGTRWAVFEPNVEATWSRLRTLCEAFLGDLWRRGAFIGGRPSEAFYVRCGRDTMTRADLAAGRLVVIVGVAPLRPAEFVVLRLVLRP